MATSRGRYWVKAKKPDGFQSGFEKAIDEQLKAMGVAYEYEPFRIPYTKPPASYTPDFVLDNGIIIEAKGRFVSSDRSKFRCLKTQHPDLDIRFIFNNPNERISKQSKTTYAMWCERYGFPYSKKVIPNAWMLEPVEAVRKEALKRFAKEKD
jgi:hypothetical protein